MSEITKKSIEHLAELSRLDLTDHEKEKFTDDLGKILSHFEELKKVSTDNVTPMTGGTDLKNIMRNDELSKDAFTATDKIVESFPERENGYNKVPGVFNV